ncbi:hypothetical protein CesoFtcFv8_019290 [Champsocephalus esox]|uniref:Uncharacterized protein n=1 Tax=Champsocephalus esox TaxID=159716 RepID=A0AAN8GQP0_9TELE|nr:hypothetical protein CesoFtcFv8_019290 [Champsocephalus esox]
MYGPAREHRHQHSTGVRTPRIPRGDGRQAGCEPGEGERPTLTATWPKTRENRRWVEHDPPNGFSPIPLRISPFPFLNRGTIQRQRREGGMTGSGTACASSVNHYSPLAIRSEAPAKVSRGPAQHAGWPVGIRSHRRRLSEDVSPRDGRMGHTS